MKTDHHNPAAKPVLIDVMKSLSYPLDSYALVLYAFGGAPELLKGTPKCTKDPSVALETPRFAFPAYVTNPLRHQPIDPSTCLLVRFKELAGAKGQRFGPTGLTFAKT